MLNFCQRKTISRVFFLLAAMVLSSVVKSQTVDHLVADISPAANLVADAQTAASKGIPILLVVSRDDCGFCRQLKREILIPMRRSGDYEEKLIMRELNVDWQAGVTDFEGVRRSALSLAELFDATLTPTVLLLGPGGREMAERLIGINTVEMYGYYLDQAIDTAIVRIRGESR